MYKYMLYMFSLRKSSLVWHAAWRDYCRKWQLWSQGGIIKGQTMHCEMNGKNIEISRLLVNVITKNRSYLAILCKQGLTLRFSQSNHAIKHKHMKKTGHEKKTHALLLKCYCGLIIITH